MVSAKSKFGGQADIENIPEKQNWMVSLAGNQVIWKNCKNW